ncbi:hypothetical protein MTR67_033540 [Solanum verrucosum]|uniref:Uncharacterized protein n=1 Tax=Solanum verrucosum TaxID=315347 RepID=A0AAF0U6G6_SOLVR|nr:hypothetical protein MTR67_033540 [Solanum verrucosum]
MLGFNNFNGEVPSWFGVFHQLQVLNLRNNSFSGSIPSLFSNISTLQTLHLACNSLRGADPRRDWKSAIEDWVPTNCIPASFVCIFKVGHP